MLEKDGTPKMLWSGKWSPICGHHFWGNQYGSKSFCQKLGYPNGKHVRASSSYSEDAIQVGKCNEGEVLTRCTAGWNSRVLGRSGINCNRGQRVKIKITCDGYSSNSAISSCGMKRVLICCWFFLSHVTLNIHTHY